MRALAAAPDSAMIRPRPLIDDRVRKPADAEQWRYPAHAFGMSQTNVAAGPQAVIEVFRRLAAGRIVKIYQDVAAKDQVKIAVARHVLRVNHVGPGKLDG